MFRHAVVISDPSRRMKKYLDVLGHFPNQTHPIFVGFPKAQYAAGADADPSVPNSGYRVQTLVIRSCRDNL